MKRGEVGRLQAEDVREVEPRIDRVELHQAAGQESGADQQHERGGELAHDQRALRAAPADAAGGAAAAAGHRAHRIVEEPESRGAHANTRASAIDTTSVKLSTQPSSAISPVRLVKRLAYSGQQIEPATASPSPSTPPTIESTRFSASS